MWTFYWEIKLYKRMSDILQANQKPQRAALLKTKTKRKKKEMVLKSQKLSSDLYTFSSFFTLTCNLQKYPYTKNQPQYIIMVSESHPK